MLSSTSQWRITNDYQEALLTPSPRGFALIGCTAIEQRLQHGVSISPEDVLKSCSPLCSAGDYQSELHELGCWTLPYDNFYTVFNALSSLANLKVLDLVDTDCSIGDFWEPLSVLESLESLAAFMRSLKAQPCESVTKLSELSTGNNGLEWGHTIKGIMIAKLQRSLNYEEGSRYITGYSMR